MSWKSTEAGEKRLSGWFQFLGISSLLGHCEKKYNLIDFLIKMYFLDFVLKYDQKCHENEHQLEKKGSVDDFDF